MAGRLFRGLLQSSRQEMVVAGTKVIQVRVRKRELGIRVDIM